MGAMTPADRARRLLDEQMRQLGELRNAHTRDPRFKQWRQTTLTVIQRIWPGEPTKSERFRRVPFSTPSSRAPASVVRETYERGCAEAGNYLRMLLAEIDNTGLPTATTAARRPTPRRLSDDDFPVVDLPGGPASRTPPADTPAAEPEAVTAPAARPATPHASSPSAASSAAADAASSIISHLLEVGGPEPLATIDAAVARAPAMPPPPAAKPVAPPSPSAAPPAPPAMRSGSTRAGRPSRRPPKPPLKEMLGFSDEHRAAVPETPPDPRPTTEMPATPAPAIPAPPAAFETGAPLAIPAPPAAFETTAPPPPTPAAPAAFETSAPPAIPAAPAAFDAPAPSVSPPRVYPAPERLTQEEVEMVDSLELGDEPDPSSVTPPEFFTPTPPDTLPSAPGAAAPADEPENDRPTLEEAANATAEFLRTSPVLGAQPKPVAGRSQENRPTQREAAEATAEFLRTSPVLKARAKPVKREPHVESRPPSPTAATLEALASEVANLGVPEGQRAGARAALLDLARQLDDHNLDWDALRRAFSFVMEYPGLARRVVPMLIPYLDSAA